MTEIIFLREDSSRKSNMMNELISVNRMSQEFKEKLSKNIDIHNNDMSSKEVRDVNIGVNKYTSMNAVYEFTQFPVYESTADTVNVSDTEEIVQCPTEILPAPSDYLDDKSDDVNLSITTSFNSTEKTLGFRDILENLMSTPLRPNKLEAERNEDDHKIVEKGLCTSSNYIPSKCIYLKERDNEKKKWPSNTILVTGDSILNNIEENRLSKKFNVKVRSFPGADICDMYDYITPLLRKEPAYIILHIGSNDAVNRSSDEIVKRVFRLKDHIESILPYVKVYLSSPIPRYDNVKAGFVIHQIRTKLKDMENVIQNKNVDVSCIGRAGLHPNGNGSGRLAMNYISVMRRF